MFSINNAIAILTTLAGGERPMAQVPKEAPKVKVPVASAQDVSDRIDEIEKRIHSVIDQVVGAELMNEEESLDEAEINAWADALAPMPVVLKFPVWEGGEVTPDYTKDLPQWGRSGRKGWKELEDDNGLRWIFPASHCHVNELVASYCSPWRMNNGLDQDGGHTPLFKGDRRRGCWEACTPALVDWNNRVVRQGTVR